MAALGHEGVGVVAVTVVVVRIRATFVAPKQCLCAEEAREDDRIAGNCVTDPGHKTLRGSDPVSCWKYVFSPGRAIYKSRPMQCVLGARSDH